MRAVKLVIFFLVLIFLGVLVFQNQGVFMDKKALALDLKVWHYETPEFELAVYFLGFFLIGLLISYFYGLGQRFKARRIIAGHLETIRRSEEELRTLRNVSHGEQTTPPKEEDTA